MNSGNSQISAPLVSICLPAYKHTHLLQRCLDSVAAQSFPNFEVIITDDTPDDSTEQFIKNCKYTFPLLYQRNSPALGSPANWNAGIKMARGQYIKMMHHDDWFAVPDALEKFCKALDDNPQSLFAFAANRDFVDGKAQPLRCDFVQELEQWKKDKTFLVTYNFIGDPSTIIFRNHKGLLYDERMKWCVDTDFNLTLFELNDKVVFIEEELVHIGTHPGQVTHTVQHDASIVLYENILMLNKHKITQLNLKQFDYYWRMIRNFKVRNKAALQSLAREQAVPSYMNKMLWWQSKTPYSILKTGFISKMLMTVSYLFCGGR